MTNQYLNENFKLIFTASHVIIYHFFLKIYYGLTRSSSWNHKLFFDIRDNLLTEFKFRFWLSKKGRWVAKNNIWNSWRENWVSPPNVRTFKWWRGKLLIRRFRLTLNNKDPSVRRIRITKTRVNKWTKLIPDKRAVREKWLKLCERIFVRFSS